MEEIIKKFKFKDLVTVLNAPSNLAAEFEKLGFTSNFEIAKKSANTLIFINNQAEFIQFLRDHLAQIEYDSVLWFAYPKGTSKVKTDINRDSMWKIGQQYGIDAVTAVSIDTTWSALRFRPIEMVGKK
jgi:hypothetical protein